MFRTETRNTCALVLFAVMAAGCGSEDSAQLGSEKSAVAPKVETEVRAVHSDRCVDVAGSATGNVNIAQWSCHGGDNQKWELVSQDSDVYQFKAKHSGSCMTAISGGNVAQRACDTTNKHKWKLESLGNDTYRIKSVRFNDCLTVKDAATTDGTNITHTACGDGNHQKFKLNQGGGGGGTTTGELTNGQAEQVSGATGEWKHFFIDVPAGATDFKAEISGGTGDADLYTRFNSQPTETTYDCRPYTNGNNENCTVSTPQTGRYHVSIKAYAAYSNLSLVASYTAGGGGGGGGGGDKTFYTTCVQDDLDASDRVDFVQQFTALGYTNLGENTNVSSSALKTLMARSDITTLYHTGHGFEGGIATAGDSLTLSSVQDINAQNVIFATCLTLSDTGWKNKMRASSQNVLGYTKVSYDFTDNQQVARFSSAIGEGQSYIRAWYSSNVAFSSLSDRWCGYVRESSGIVEYSARSGNVPAADRVVELEQVDTKGNLKVATWLLSDTRDLSQDFDLNTAHRVSGAASHDMAFYDQSSEFLRKRAITRDRAVQAAQRWLGNSLPSDAKLDSVTPIEITTSSGNDIAVAYRVRYARTLDDLDVRSNGPAHHIELLVNNDRVVASSRLWPTLVQASQGPQAEPLLRVDAALASAVSVLTDIVKAPVNIVDVLPVYGNTSSGNVVPAFAFVDDAGGAVIVDARTGDLIL